MDIHAVGAEYAGAQFGDLRLSKRVVRLAQEMSASPATSFPRALDESGLEGAYRFFNNSRVSPEAILTPHRRETLRRMGDDDTILAVHDTTTLSFRNEGQRQGFGSLTGHSQQLWTHATLALKADGTRCPLGLLVLSTAAEIRHERWLDNVEEANRAVGTTRRLVHIFDREADDYAIFAALSASDARFVIRSQSDRILEKRDEATVRISDALADATLVVEREVLLSARGLNKGSKAKKSHPARKSRMATLSIAATSVVLRAPTKKKGVPPTLPLHVVRVWEASPPIDSPAVEWLLVTNEPLETEEEMLRVVDWYRARWSIEELFKALKTGCSIEKRQLEDFDAFSNAVAFFVPIAWQLLLLRHRARYEESSDGASSLPIGMLDVLRHIARKPLPDKPTARDVWLAVAALGGHLKRNGDPGWQTLGYGYDKLREAAEIWALAAKTLRSDQS